MLKNCAKKLIYAVAEKGGPALMHAVEAAQVVSFDVFDTLVKRDVEKPTDVFTLLEKQLILSQGAVYEDFAHLRMQGELQAYAAHPEREITMEEIYFHLPLDVEKRAKAMQAECNMEVQISTPNIELKQVYMECIRRGKEIYFISDMYLPAACIQEILNKNGYTQGKLYVSAQSGYTKHSGMLFAYVQHQEHLDTKRWIHVGDTISSDFFAPKKLGIKSVLIKRNVHVNPYVDGKTARTDKDYRRLNYFIDTRISRYIDPYERIGYAVLGPLLYGFTCWLEENVPEDECLLFLARDGLIMQRAFKLVSKRPSIYFYISRNAIRNPYLSRLESPEMIPARPQGKREYTQKSIAMLYGITEQEADEILTANGLEPNAVVKNTAEEQEVCRAIWPLAKRKARVQCDNLQEYICQLGLPNRCALVDVGWSGTTQAFLAGCRFAGKTAEIVWNGYYFGSFKKDSAPIYAGLQKESFLFDEDKNKRIYDSVINSRIFFEMLFLATHGTTEAYSKTENGIVEPVIGPPDNNTEIDEKIARIQEVALDFVADMKASPLKIILKVGAKAAGGNYLGLARVPKLETIELFGDFRYEVEGKFSFSSVHPLRYYIFRPRVFISDFKNSLCKSWFLKSVFKIPLPYIQMLNLLRRLTKQ